MAAENPLERAAELLANGDPREPSAQQASAHALVSIAETLKLLIQPDPATRETWFCHDCGRSAGPSCSYWGHGITEIAELVDSYEGCGDRLMYTKGMRAALRLLLEDPKLPGPGASVVRDHHQRCEAVIATLEGTDG